jgi:hypothetical protein
MYHVPCTLLPGRCVSIPGRLGYSTLLQIINDGFQGSLVSTGLEVCHDEFYVFLFDITFKFGSYFEKKMQTNVRVACDLLPQALYHYFMSEWLTQPW